MKGNKQINVILIMILFIALLVVFGFRFKYSVEILEWRLARIAMVNANLMAGGEAQEEMGTVDPEKIRVFNSYGYGVTYGIFDPEKKEFVMHSIDPFFEGIFNWDEVFTEAAGLVTGNGYKILQEFGYVKKSDAMPWDYATYSLPVTYKDGDELKYGLLFVGIYPTMSLEQASEIVSETKLLAERLEAVKSEG